MTADVVARSQGQELSAQSIVRSVKSNLKIPKGIAAEHILISGDGTDTVDTPTTVGKRMTLVNRARGIRTELTLFNEGFLKIRNFKRNKLIRDYLLELRFLDPQPTRSRRIIMPSFWAAIGCGGTAALTWLLTKVTALDAYLIPATIVLATGAIIAILLFAYQSGEKSLFVTANGKVPVLMLLANFGCFRQCRKIVPEISRAIAAARSRDVHDRESCLRAEMHDLYRLRNAGVISIKACTNGSSRILARFG